MKPHHFCLSSGGSGLYDDCNTPSIRSFTYLALTQAHTHVAYMSNDEKGKSSGFKEVSREKMDETENAASGTALASGAAPGSRPIAKTSDDDFIVKDSRAHAELSNGNGGKPNNMQSGADTSFSSFSSSLQSNGRKRKRADETEQQPGTDGTGTASPSSSSSDTSVASGNGAGESKVRDTKSVHFMKMNRIKNICQGMGLTQMCVYDPKTGVLKAPPNCSEELSHRHINAIERTKWTDEEDDRLRELVKKFGKKWNVIALYMPFLGDYTSLQKRKFDVPRSRG